MIDDMDMNWRPAADRWRDHLGERQGQDETFIVWHPFVGELAPGPTPP